MGFVVEIRTRTSGGNLKKVAISLQLLFHEAET